MKFLKTTAVILAIAGFSSQAMAQDTGTYVNAGVDLVSGEDFTSYNISAKLGYNFTEFFGVEGQAAFGVINDTIEDIDPDFDDIDVGVDSSFGGFGVVRFPASESFDIFARAGYHFTQIGAGTDGVGASVDTDGFAAGAGGQYFFTANDGIRFEYTYYDLNVDSDLIDDEDLESGSADVFTVSYVRKF